jgi:hypothetical protein
MKQEIKIIRLSSLSTKPKYMLFIDHTENESGEFSLLKASVNTWEELLSGSGTDIDNFEEQTQNLAKYFDAQIFIKQPE